MACGALVNGVKVVEVHQRSSRLNVRLHGEYMSEKALRLLKERRDFLIALGVERKDWPTYTSWYAGSKPLIAQHFPKHLQQFDGLMKPRWVSFPRVYYMGGRNDYSDLNRKEAAANDAVVKGVKTKLLELVDMVIELSSDDEPTDALRRPSAAASPDAKVTKTVFVVHGHDDEMKQYVARVLSTLGMNPIILHEQPNAGQTLIEKFESHADVGFAVVLLSPDDKGFAAGQNAKLAKPRARQNVILELGYFVGLLKRSRVFALKRDELEIPSDFAGVVYTPYDAAGHWRFMLAQELQAAGFDVDANALLGLRS